MRGEWKSMPTRRPETAFPVVVIGCGQSGLLAGIRLREAGIPFTIVEKNAGVGGTWFENSYPGARVDVGNHFYCYSFEPSDQWTEFFAQQPELQAYFEGVMHKHAIEPHVRWETEVLGAAWDDDTATWTVRVRASRRLRGVARRASGDLRGRSTQSTPCPRDPRPGHVRGPRVPLGSMGSRPFDSTAPASR